METVQVLNKIYEDLEFLKNKVNLIEQEITVIRNIEPEVREEYIEKLKKIEKEKGRVFDNKEDFLNFLKNEL